MKKNITLFYLSVLTQFCFGQSFTNGNFSNGNQNWNNTGCQVETNTENLYNNTSSVTNIVAEIDATNSLCQQVSGFNIGQTYTLTFNATRRDNCYGSPQDAPNPMEIFLSIDGGVLNNYSIIKNGGYDLSQTVSISFIATQNSHFFSINANQTQSCGMVVDNFNLDASSADNALDFDGIDDYISMDNIAPVLAGDSSYTFEFWMKADINSNGVYPALFAINQYSSNTYTQHNLVLMMNSSTSISTFGNLIVAIGNVYYYTDRQIGDNSCHHIAIITNGNNVDVFVDGSMVNYDIPAGVTQLNSSIYPLNNSNNYSIGQEHDYDWGGLSQFYNGDIDEFRVWNTARTQSQIQSNMNVQLTGNENGLVAYYDCNQGIANGNNTTEVSLTNSSNLSNLDGQFNGFALNGPSSNFVLMNCRKLSVKENWNTNEIKTYPNPTHSILNIELSNKIRESKILIYDISGKVVKSISSLPNNNLSINVNNLESGVYIITIIDPMTNEVKQTKFVKQ